MTSTDFDPVAYVRTGTCGSGTESSCSTSNASGTANVTVNLTPGSSFYLFVDGATSAAGAYDVAVNFGACP